MNRIEIINTLIAAHGYRSYLEIGVERGNCFFRVHCQSKLAVDPNPLFEIPPDDPNDMRIFKGTSNAFWHQNTEQFDIVFIDGLHHSQQVYIDILDALRVLKPGGTIVCHDMLPKTKRQQEVPQPIGQVAWTGDCWRAWMHLRTRRTDLRMAVMNMDWGVGLIQRGQQELVPKAELTWKNHKKYRSKWMNVVTEIPKEFLSK